MKKAKMTAAQKIHRIVDRHSDDDWSFHPRYSGRYMMGRECPAIACRFRESERATRAIKKALPGTDVHQDSFGMGVIVYAPEIPSDHDPDDEPDFGPDDESDDDDE